MLRALALIPMSAAASYCLGSALSNDWSSEDSQTPEPVSPNQSTDANLSNFSQENLNSLEEKTTVATPQASTTPEFSSVQLPAIKTLPIQPVSSRQTFSPPKPVQVQALPPIPINPPQVVQALPIDKIVARSIGSDLRTISMDSTSNNSVAVLKKPQAKTVALNNKNTSVEVSTTLQTRTIPAFTPVSQPPQPLLLTTSESVTAQAKITAPATAKVKKYPKSELAANSDRNKVEELENSGELITDGNLARNTLRDLPTFEEKITEVVPPPNYSQPSQALGASESTEIVPLPTFSESIQKQPLIAPNESMAIPNPPPVESISRGVDETYILGAGDILGVNIFRVPEFSGEQRVGVDGSVNLPLVGKVYVEGMNLQEVESAIASQYQPELRSPTVTVSLLQPRPLQIAISGEIQQPGSYVLPLVNNAQFPSVAQAVQVAGGMTQAADLEGVQIRRSQPSGVTQTITLNLWKLLQTGDLSQDLTLRDGDVIIIPATTEVDLTTTAQLAASNLASTTQSSDVAVVGEVFRPGAYRLGGGQNATSRPTVSQAIQTAGGIKPSANVRQIQVRRPTHNGTQQLINIDLWQLLQEGDLSQDLALQEGDTVIIPTATEITATEAAQITSTNLAPDVIRVNVAGEVKQPGTVEVPSNTTLNEALLSVGGLNERSEEVVELVRFNPDGSLTRREIQVNLNQGIDPQTNPLLWHNDIVIAGRTRSARITDKISDILGPIIQLLPPLRLLF